MMVGSATLLALPTEKSMEAIVPRWEWRTFSTSFGDADRRFRQLPPGKVQESDELYLLSPNCDANVKIRDQLMDIKALEQVNPDGLEQWRPVVKGKFPLPAAEVARVCAALRVAPLSPRENYTLEQIQAELADPSRGVRAVSVHKRRQRYTVGKCLAEMTELIAEGRPTRTVAIEFEDAAILLAAVQGVGLGRFENISYPRGLKRLLDLPA
jgi:exopolyphosphatase/guanosine-5'-triphosphate,3'-diphosphate pyrophosphatase